MKVFSDNYHSSWKLDETIVDQPYSWETISTGQPTTGKPDPPQTFHWRYVDALWNGSIPFPPEEATQATGPTFKGSS
jgi:hypothetical protein